MEINAIPKQYQPQSNSSIKGVEEAKQLEGQKEANAADEKAPLKPRYDEYIKGEKAPKSKKEEDSTCTANTDAVDREIEKLKKLKEQLQSELNKAKSDNPEKAKEIEAQLENVNNQLKQKDNDSYRKANTKFTYGSAPTESSDKSAG